ncbi:MAG: N-6 DNA methylase [Verrucomicrobiota bacterium]
MIQLPIATIEPRWDKQLTAKVRKDKGAHYTPEALAAFVAEQIVANLPPNSRNLRILDPACGDGGLIHALASKLGDFNHHYEGYDVDAAALNRARKGLCAGVAPDAFALHHADFLAQFDGALDDLFQTQSSPLFDAAISNPPYVRTQVLGALSARRLASVFNHSGRIDLYFAFLAGISLSLKPGGIAGIIVSNRFMTTKAGADVRAGLLRDFDVLHIWDFGDTKLFEAAVLPVVLVLRKKQHPSHTSGDSRFTTIYTTSATAEAQAMSVFDALTLAGPVAVNGTTYQVNHGTLETRQASDVWRLTTLENDTWLDTVKRNTFRTFGEIGKIRVGVKTTADNVFIRDWTQLPETERPELLRPLITHHVAERFHANLSKSPRQILYTHEIRDGKRRTIAIGDYPVARQYLEAHREQLEGRRYVIDAKREWFEIWVPQNPASWQQPKLIFTDISENSTCWIDTSGAIVNGDCYWMIPARSEDSDLLWLALAIGNSSFIESFYDHKFNNKLYAGRRRFMTQYVEQFPIPDPTTKTAKTLISLAKEIHRRKPTENTSVLEAKCGRLVEQAFGVLVEEVVG